MAANPITHERRRTRADVRLGKVPLHPTHAFRSYRKVLREYIDDLQKIADRKIIKALPDILARQDHARRDTDQKLLAATLRSVLRVWGESHSKEKISADVESMLADVAKHSTREAKRVLSIDFVSSPGAKEIVQSALNENIRLITKMTDEALFGSEDGTRLGVKQAIERGFRDGRLTADVAKDIERRFDVSRARAELIARDQIGTINADMTADRFQSAGVVDFAWITASDNAVREEHAEINGDVFSYADGGHPTEGLPGDPINCRCAQQPVIPDIE